MRRTHWTISLICEGTAELQFATTIRECYLPRNCGTTLQPQNAHGGGGKKALWMARTLQSQTEYNSYGILIDTDEHWTDAERYEARAAGIVVIENSPCLEATLLKIDGKRASANTKENKEFFVAEYGGAAHSSNLIKRNFTKAKFDDARVSVGALDAFLRLIKR
jgi:hypothetical protein